MAHTEYGAEDMLSLKVACNTLTEERRTILDLTDSGETDMLSFKVAFNPPRNMLAMIDRYGGLWGYMG